MIGNAKFLMYLTVNSKNILFLKKNVNILIKEL